MLEEPQESVLEMCEDRLKVRHELQQVTEEVSNPEAVPRDAWCSQEPEAQQEEVQVKAGARTLDAILQVTRSQDKSTPVAAFAALRGPMINFIESVRLAEGSLSKSAIHGVRNNENFHNFVEHELSLARQAAAFSGARRSRMSAWQSVQQNLSQVCKKQKQKTKTVWTALSQCVPTTQEMYPGNWWHSVRQLFQTHLSLRRSFVHFDFGLRYFQKNFLILSVVCTCDFMIFC